MEGLSGKIGLVTGGSRGIGAAIVRKLIAHEMVVYFTYRSSGEVAESLASDLGPNAIPIQSDASKFDQVESLMKVILKEHGRLDVLINNAGITEDTLLLRMSEEQWDRVIEVNLKSVFNTTKQVLRTMLKQRAGSIINLSSVVGIFGNAGQANYAASKAGIIGFTKSIAKEVGSRGIRCNAIAPGFIQTEMTEVLDESTKDSFLANIPLKRLGLADEVADLVAFLSSDSSRYITGQAISICGGLNT